IAGDRASGSIRNLLDQPLRNAQLYYGKNVYDLGTIRPRGIGRVDHARAEAIARRLGRLVQNANRGQGETGTGRNQEDASRLAKSLANLLRAVLFHDAMGTRAESYPSQALANLDMTAQVTELRRPMLVADVDAPAAALSLRGDPARPTIEQTTVVRV